ncbi:MAG: peptidylprolyl isomerase [Candidatus Accumulibacter phosphatis]|uniref:Chaperone SurA n=2 Tax=Candidatus Accumulibacter cognatus TaxID=2954383 RepID=A0A7D5NBZ5_9PROT|nr:MULTISPECIES: peptidylprolyl isomerase [Candidatus Accumulibacter]MCC2867546.1 peptidylprolyl isomerase [Candidatus Accumulibacter phosphatis]MBL8400381.1 peptidylprolyl isomerase [Accumulibacter sp.]MBN8516390.1 peptidylprolyl isomerase [Accumulibacter sp.]MBO3712428.1 peptidylprolyl isomerase [Accumulibacter sp.]MCM8579975.1 peptidylprolyl isomerase [Accumulibacter sp.]
MMKFLFRGMLLAACLVGLATAQPRPARQPAAIDRIVAVVNDEVITQHELRARLDSALGQLQRQGMSSPPRNVLEKQVLERLVMDKVQLQQARDMGLRIDDAQLEQALQRIAAGNNLSLAQFRAVLEKDGIAFASFREEIRAEITIARLREREVESKIFISDGEVDNYLASASVQGGTEEEYQLAHILLRAPESASPEQIQKLRAKAEQMLERSSKGEDFAQLAAAYSDAPDGMKGGNLGWRSLDRLPTMFAEAILKLKVGEVSPVLRSSNGFHLIKLLAKRGGIAAQAVEQTHARHILIKVNEVVSESEARHKLESLHARIKHGASFAELARLFSQDGSASKGGDLGWIYPGDTVPEFERAMNLLAPGELSQPVQSPFGFHLIEVLDRRIQDVSSERRRAAARQTLRERKLDEAYQDWLRQARDRAYVEIRLDEG